MTTKQTKAELLKTIEDLEQEKHILENSVDYWEHEYNEIYDLYSQLDNMVNYNKEYINFEDLKRRLDLDNMLTDSLNNFLDMFWRYYA